MTILTAAMSMDLVTLKIAHLGRQMRDAKEIFSALKDNVDQIMANLQDGLMLFTRDARVVLVSASVERYLGRPRRELLGKTAREIFSSDTVIGQMLLEAFQFRRAVAQREIEATTGKRIQVSLDFIQEGGAQIGALLTLRDTESVRRIEDEIEMSRRLSASGRLTRGVAHEVKNPINAIVLHLQLLQNKLKEVDPDTRRHMDIIDSEIHRLDRVVQILVDFTRPRDLHVEEMDFRRLLGGRSHAGIAGCGPARSDHPERAARPAAGGEGRYRFHEAGGAEYCAEWSAIHGQWRFFDDLGQTRGELIETEDSGPGPGYSG